MIRLSRSIQIVLQVLRYPSRKPLMRKSVVALLISALFVAFPVLADGPSFIVSKQQIRCQMVGTSPVLVKGGSLSTFRARSMM